MTRRQKPKLRIVYKHLCIFGPKGAIQMCYYYYYYYLL